MSYGAILGQSKPPIDSVNVTLSSGSWTGSAAPYSITVTVNGVTTTSYQLIKPSDTITATQLNALQAANIQSGGQGSNSITLKAFGEKPSINLPIEVVLLGE